MLSGMFRALRGMQLDLFRMPEVPSPVSIPPHSSSPTAAQPSLATGISSDLNPSGTALERVLAKSTRPIQIHFSRRAHQSWSLSWRGRDAEIHLRLPESFREAPEDIAETLLTWIRLVSQRKKGDSARLGRQDCEIRLRAFLEQKNQQGSFLRLRQLRAKRAIQRLRPEGRHHDLQQAFDRVNARFFSNSLIAQITWSARLGGLSTHCQRPAPEGGTYHLITISRGYDAPDVTPEILDGVVYHECLHIVYPPVMREGRRIVHGREFRLAEKAYPHFEIWMRWHRHGLPRSLKRQRH